MSRSAGTMPIKYVKGRTSTIEFNIVMPGRAPATMPTASPARIMERCRGCSALANPAPRLRRISLTPASEDAQQAVEPDREALQRAFALGQGQVDDPHEEVEQEPGADDRRPRRRRRPRPARHHEGQDEQGGGER